MKRLIITLSFSIALAMAETQVDGPMLGLLFNSADGQVYPVQGIPGAATLGEPVAAMSRAAAASGIAVGVSGESVSVYRLKTRTLVQVEAALIPDRVAISPSGTAAALASGGRVQILRIGDAVEIAEQYDLPGEVASLAVADDGSQILAAIAEPNGTALYRNGERIGSAGAIGSIDYFQGSQNAVLADTAEGKILLLTDGALSLLAQFEGLRAAAGGISTVYAAVGSSVLAMSFDGTTRASQECSCEPSGFERLNDSAYRLSGGAAEPAWVFDASTPEGRIVFVPGGSRE